MTQKEFQRACRDSQYQSNTVPDEAHKALVHCLYVLRSAVTSDDLLKCAQAFKVVAEGEATLKVRPEGSPWNNH